MADNTAHYMWKKNNGTTPTVKTGPDQDHTTSSGNFLIMVENTMAMI
jgi:hypothetical protein